MIIVCCNSHITFYGVFSDEIQKKFGGAKAISSKDIFGDEGKARTVYVIPICICGPLCICDPHLHISSSYVIHLYIMSSLFSFHPYLYMSFTFAYVITICICDPHLHMSSPFAYFIPFAYVIPIWMC